MFVQVIEYFMVHNGELFSNSTAEAGKERTRHVGDGKIYAPFKGQ